MRNVREIAGNIAMIGGLVTSGVSTVDVFRAASTDPGAKEIQTIKYDLQEQYGVVEECGVVKIFGTDDIICSDFVSSEHSSEEEQKILDAYHKELMEETSTIFNDPIVNRRFAIDSGGMLAGIGMMVSGMALNDKKEKT